MADKVLFEISEPLEVTEDQVTTGPVITVAEEQIPELASTSSNEIVNSIIHASRRLPEVNLKSQSAVRRGLEYCSHLQDRLIAAIEADAVHMELSKDDLELFDVVDEALDEVKKDLYAAAAGSLVKKAWKSANYSYVITPFIYAMARYAINGNIASGKGLESMIKTLNAQYKLTDREKVELVFVLNDMGYPLRNNMMEGAVDQIEQFFA